MRFITICSRLRNGIPQLTIFARGQHIRFVSGAAQKIKQLHTTTAADTRSELWNENEDFFRFTRSRFLRDEAKELSRRYVKFDVEELAKHCSSGLRPWNTSMREGNWQSPNPNAGMPHFTTASEVATMDFARNILGTPAPKVLGWSSSTDNPVGAEYVIMEKIPGVQLETLWNKLDLEVKVNFVKEIAGYQRDWTLTSFSQYGGLYYKKDLSNATSLTYTNKNGEQVTDDRFAVGPSTSRHNIDDGRVDVSFDRGPWSTALDYAKAAGYRELACVTQLPQLPKSPIGLYGPQTYRPSKEKKIKALQAYMDIVEHLLPDDKSIQTSHLWHNDLHAENIFGNPENPSEICGIIDWQTTELAPLYDHTIEPYILDYQGPRINGDLLQRLDPEEIQSLFEDDPDLTPQEKKRKADSLFWRMALVSLWRHTIYMGIEPLFRALEFCETVRFTLLIFARNLFLDGEAAYLAILADQYRKDWVDIPSIHGSIGKGFPYEFTPDDLKVIDSDCEGATNGINIMGDVKEAIGSHSFRVDGTVDHEDYEEAKECIRLTKEDFMSKYPENDEERKEWEAAWPFDD